MNIFGKLLIKREIVSNIKGDTDKRLAGLKTNDITLTDVQEYDESNVVFVKFKINGDDGAEFGMTLRSKKNQLVNSLYALSAIRMADEFIDHGCWIVRNKADHLEHHYLEVVKLPSHPTLLSRKEWMESKCAEGAFAKRTISLNWRGVTRDYYIEPHGEMRKVHATKFDANQDLHRIMGHKAYSLYGIVNGEAKMLGTWYGASPIHLCNELLWEQPLEYPILDLVSSHFEYNGHPLFSDATSAKDYADNLKKRRHEVWGVKPLSKTPVLLGVYEATSFGAAAGLCPHVTKHGFFSELWYNDRPVFPTKEAAENYLRKPRGIISTVDPKTVTFEMAVDDENADKLRQIIKDAKPQLSIGYMSGFEVMPVQHLGFPNEVTFVRSKKNTHKVQDLPYFPEVAQAIGTTDAAMELYKVLKCIKCHDDIMNEELDMAFTWHLSPQGDSFWAEVEARIQDQRAAEEQEILNE